MPDRLVILITLELTMTIRRAVAADANLLAGLSELAQQLHLSARPDHFKSPSSSELAEWYGTLLLRPTTRIWIAEEAETPVGYVLSVLRETPGNPFVHAHRWCEVDQIAVDPHYRQNGIARALVLKATADARAEGIDVMETSCWSFNGDAHAFFQRLGFVPKSVRFEFRLPA